MTRASDRIWMALNKKPHGKATSYFFVVYPWLVAGVMWTLVILGMAAGVKIGELQIAAHLLTLAIFYSGVIVYIDYKYKYADAIHNHYLQHRQSKLDEITSNK